MPPIPSTLDHDVLDLIASIDRRKKDLLHFQLPRLRSCKGPLSVQQQLAAEIREDTENLARQVDELDIAVEDQNGERNRQLLRRSVEELRQDLTSLKRDTRLALLTSKQNIDALNSSNREELFRSPVISEKNDSNEKVTEDALTRANNDVTEALRRTIGLMQGELERSVLSTQMLDSSTATLRSTSATHETLDSVLVFSKHLITALEKADKMDRLLISAGLVFFFLVVLFILKQRVIDRGLRIALFWTRFIPSRAGKTVASLNKMEQGELTAMATAIASGATTVASTLVPSLSSSLTGTTSFCPPKPTVLDPSPDETIINILPSEVEGPVLSTPSESHDEL